MNKIPSFIYKRSNQITQICLVSAFVLLFLIIYKPLGLDDLTLTALQGRGLSQSAITGLVTASLIILGGIIVSVSRLVMGVYTRKKGNLSYIGYICWVAAEIVIMSIVYTFGSHINNPTVSLDSLFSQILYKTCLVIMIPYIMSYCIMIWQEKSRQLKAMKNELESKNKDLSDPYLQILDEKGEMRLSIRKENLLYIEAEDNYVCVCYLAGNNTKNIMVRTTLKRVAEQLNCPSVLRCHRSYMVNTDHIKVLRREKDGFYIEMGIDCVPDIPISKTYGEAITSHLMKY